MTDSIIPFFFEDHGLRVIMQADDPWFVAVDVCRILDLTNPSMATSALDDDERAKFNLGRQGDTNIISEGGLYTLILRSRDAVTPGTVPHRFRKWITGELLPTLRRTGRYDMMVDPAPCPDRFGEDLGTREKLTMIRETRLLHGIPAGRRMWSMLDMPDVSGGGIASNLLVSPEEGRACLNYLVGLDLGGRAVSDWIADGQDGAALNRVGLRVRDDGLFVSNSTAVFAGSRWSGGRHRVALSALDGVYTPPSPLTLLGRGQRGLVVPLSAIAGRFHAA